MKKKVLETHEPNMGKSWFQEKDLNSISSENTGYNENVAGDPEDHCQVIVSELVKILNPKCKFESKFFNSTFAS